MTEISTWKPYSWKKYHATQQPVYPNAAEVNQVIAQIKSCKIVTTIPRITKLLRLLKHVSCGKSLIMQAGDCAESFNEFSQERVIAFAQLLTKMQQTLAKKSNKNVIKIGRIAGQFAKPRTTDKEIVNSQSIPVYRGDIINSYEANIQSRIADPKRMMLAYKQAQQTITLLNKFDKQYANDNCEHHTTFISHEALLLPYEQAFIQHDETLSWYSGSADNLWIGKRTAHPESAHIEMIRGIANPVAIKICADISADDVLKIIDKTNPHNLTGKVILIIRMGNEITKKLPKLIQKITTARKSVIWLTDPMHANTYKTATKYKTRCLTAIYKEIEFFLNIIHSYNCYAGGIHLEISPFDVTECIDTNYINEDQLCLNYKTLCDPRLNPQQALAVSSFFSSCLQKYQISRTTIN